jgi:hypothetical protein
MARAFLPVCIKTDKKGAETAKSGETEAKRPRRRTPEKAERLQSLRFAVIMYMGKWQTVPGRAAKARKRRIPFPAMKIECVRPRLPARS